MVNEKYYDGIIAEWYDEWLKERTDDINFYSGFFSGFKGRVLELACGTGRILLPIAKQGTKIDGLDSSADMLARLDSRAKEQGLSSISTYKQSMCAFELPTKYDAILVATGSFQLLTSETDAIDCLISVRKHLNQEGFLLIEVFVPWSSIRADKVDAFTVTRDSKREDGSRCIVSEKFGVNIAKQIIYSVFRYEIFKNGRLETSLVGDFPLRWYWEDEIENIIKRVGFTEVKLLTDSSLYKEGSVFLFKASSNT